MSYSVELKNGETLTGIIANETDSSLTLQSAAGQTTTALRSSIKRIEASNLSLMPEGLEAGLQPQDMADLIDYILEEPAGQPIH